MKLKDTVSGASSEFSVKQTLTPVISIDPKEFTIDELGGVVEVKVNSNIPLDIQYGDSWVSDGGKTGTDNFNYIQKIKVSKFSGDQDSRTTTVSFTSQNSKWSNKETVNITQKCNLLIKDSDVDILIGKSYSLNVINNTSGSLLWESSNTSVATVDNNGKVTGVGIGSATITVTSADGLYSSKCSVYVKDITDFVTAQSAGGSVVVINGWIQAGSKISWIFTNSSSETVRLKSMQLVEGQTGREGNIMSTETNVPGGSSVSYTTTIGALGIYAPVTCRFRYEYNGKEYMTTAVFSGSLW